MDVPVSLGILLTFFASVWATVKGGAVYYDSAIMFVCLLLAARYIEARLSKFALDVLYNAQTTEWQMSYDGRKREPVTLPVKFPMRIGEISAAGMPNAFGFSAPGPKPRLMS